VLVVDVVTVVASMKVVRTVSVAVVVVSTVTVADEVDVWVGAVAVVEVTDMGMVRQAQALEIWDAAYVLRTDSESGLLEQGRLCRNASRWVIVWISETVAVSVDVVVSMLVMVDIRVSVTLTVAVVSETLDTCKRTIRGLFLLQ
jgi:hypothetical protein